MCTPEALWTLAEKTESVKRKAVESGGCAQPGQRCPRTPPLTAHDSAVPLASGRPTGCNRAARLQGRSGRGGKPLHVIARLYMQAAAVTVVQAASKLSHAREQASCVCIPAAT